MVLGSTTSSGSILKMGTITYPKNVRNRAHFILDVGIVLEILVLQTVPLGLTVLNFNYI